MKTIAILFFVAGLALANPAKGETLALYNFNGRLQAPCPYPKELAEKQKAASYVPNADEGECGPPLLHQYGKYGSRSWYDPREKEGVLHMKFAHAWLFDQFHTEKPLFGTGDDFNAEVQVSVQYSYGMDSLLCSVGGLRLQIMNYKHLTGKFTVMLDDGQRCLGSALLDSDIYYTLTFGRTAPDVLFLSVNGKPCASIADKVKDKAPEELWIGGANDIKIGLIQISQTSLEGNKL